MANGISDGIWELNVFDGKNPIHTGSFLNSYDPREFTPDEVAAREGGQNAMDAGREIPGITELHIHSLGCTGAKKKALLDLFSFEQIMRQRQEIWSSEQRNKRFSEKVADFLDGDSLHATVLRDFNTCGLGGRWDRYERSDHFARLVCALNLDDKADGEENSGGSFGLGKTTYARSSGIYTVIYHSVFEPTEDTEGAHRRLMVSGVYPKHKIGEVTYGGFAYWGARIPDRPDETMPFINEEAEAIWNRVCEAFEADLSRPKDKPGTDIVILMDDLSLERLKRAVEDYYFPALIKHDLSVTLYDDDGTVSHPTPLERMDLDQFTRLYTHVTKGNKEKKEGYEADLFNKLHKHSLGRFAFAAAEPDEAKSEKKNCVALLRGTGMVINYIKLGSEQYEPAVGLFMAHKDIWPYLIASENAAHSEWSHKARRLHENFPEIGPDIVKAVGDRVASRFGAFQKSLQPEVSTSRTETGMLARLLSSALKGKGGSKPVPPGSPNPASVHLTRRNRAENKTVWLLRLEENEHTPAEKFPLRLSPSFSIAGDQRQIPVKHMPFLVKDITGQVLKNESKPELVFDFQRGDQIELLIELSNPGQHNFVVQCKCVADIEEGDQ